MNGFYGNIQGPFTAGEDVFTKINAECNNNIRYISKIGIHQANNHDIDISGNGYTPQTLITLTDDQKSTIFVLGKTSMLELEDCKITGISFTTAVDDNTFIDYQYVSRE